MLKSGTRLDWIKWLVAVPAIAAISMSAASGCEVVSIDSPNKSGTIADAKPLIKWTPVEGVPQYRVTIESRIPEGKIIAAFDANVGESHFKPPTPLTDFRAAVKVRVTHGCTGDQGPMLREAPATFYIDTEPLCRFLGGVALIDEGRGLRWGSPAGAVHYELKWIDVANGRVLRKAETRRSEYTFDSQVEGAIVSVRPYCATGYGQAATILLP